MDKENSQQLPLEWKTRDIPVLYGVEIMTDDYFVLSQITIHVSDRWTDRQNCDSNTMRCITCNRTLKIAYTITHPAYLMPKEPELVLWN